LLIHPIVTCATLIFFVALIPFIAITQPIAFVFLDVFAIVLVVIVVQRLPIIVFQVTLLRVSAFPGVV
jgi:hypothetical protein